MDTNRTSTNLTQLGKVIYPDLSYVITGILFAVHNELGQYAREKQYSDLLGEKFRNAKVPYKREVAISGSGNIIDFILDGKIILELKAVRIFTRDHYRQIQNYLQQTGIRLGLLVNFRDRYLKPVRIIRIDSYHL